jgi:hypothetical protein
MNNTGSCGYGPSEKFLTSNPARGSVRPPHAEDHVSRGVDFQAAAGLALSLLHRHQAPL